MRAALALALATLVACTTLPDPESPGAQAYARRCGECHRPYAPGSLTWPMWEYQLGRMKTLFSQLRRPWLGAEEEELVAGYLQRHAGGQ
ncbi:MAG: hypothetical protein ACREQL_15705 [Candidatus Binatia bacterium]